MAIPPGLIRHIADGQCTLFVGTEILLEASGQRSIPSTAELAGILAEDSGYDEPNRSLPRVAQYYKMVKGENSLRRVIRDCYDVPAITPFPAHHLITQLPFSVIFTTTYDEFLEEALRQASKYPRVIVHNEEIAYGFGQDQVTLIKLFGTISQPDSLIVTIDEHLEFSNRLPTVSSFLKARFAASTLMFVGYSLDDMNFQRLYVEVNREVDRHKRPAYAVQREASDYNIRWWQSKGVEVITADLTLFLQELDAELAKYDPPAQPVQSASAAAATRQRATRPYKALNYFEPEDASIFFGRQSEIERLMSLIESYRTVILYGTSGTGKTSLINAGVIPVLHVKNYISIRVRAIENPTVAIRREINLLLPEPFSANEPSLHSLLKHTTEMLEKNIVIFLDQFEEFFIRLTLEFRKAFVAELGDVYADRELPVKFVFSLRKDYLAEMSEVEERIVEIFKNKLWLQRLGRDDARQAIVAPLQPFGIDYEHSLVEALLADLYDDGVYPPHLQIICNILYDRRTRGSHHLTLEMYQRLGGAQKILGGYVEEVLFEFPGHQQTVARAALTELVTSRDTKTVLTEQELLQRLNADARTPITVLDKLVDAWLIRRDERGGNVYYELAHEYLVEELRTWIDEEDRELKKAREVLEQELDNADRFGTHMDHERLDLLLKYHDRLRLSTAAQNLILRSAVEENHRIKDWLRIIENPEAEVRTFLALLSNAQEQTRIRAAQLLGSVQHVDVAEPLFRSAMNDASAVVREAAAQSLARGHGMSHVATLNQLLKQEERAERERASEVLAHMVDAGNYAMPDNWRPWLRVARALAKIRLGRKWDQSLRAIRDAALGGAVGGLLLMALASYFPASSDLGYESTVASALFFGILFGISLGLLLGSFIAAGLWARILLGKEEQLVAGLIGATSGGILATVAYYGLIVLIIPPKSAEVIFRSLLTFAILFGGCWPIIQHFTQKTLLEHRLANHPLIVGLDGAAAGLLAAILLEQFVYFHLFGLHTNAFGAPVAIVGYALLGAAISLGFSRSGILAIANNGH